MGGAGWFQSERLFFKAQFNELQHFLNAFIKRFSVLLTHVVFAFFFAIVFSLLFVNSTCPNRPFALFTFTTSTTMNFLDALNAAAVCLTCGYCSMVWFISFDKLSACGANTREPSRNFILIFANANKLFFLSFFFSLSLFFYSLSFSRLAAFSWKLLQRNVCFP